MIVDDSLVTRKILETCLGREEIAWSSYPDAEEALRALHAEPDRAPDVVIVDIGLPGMDGYTFIRLLRSNQQFDATAVVVPRSNTWPYH